MRSRPAAAIDLTGGSAAPALGVGMALRSRCRLQHLRDTGSQRAKPYGSAGSVRAPPGEQACRLQIVGCRADGQTISIAKSVAAAHPSASLAFKS